MTSNAQLETFKQAMVAGTIVARACGDDHKHEESPCEQVFGAAPNDHDRRVLQSLAAEWRDTLAPFFGAHAGANLFVVDGTPGLILAPPREWEHLADEMGEWWRDLDEDDVPEEMREMLESAVVFGRIDEAATYFVLVRAGELRQQVAMFCHDGLELVPLAANFAEFLQLVPTKGIDWIGSDVRYLGDNSTDQYYPIAFRPNGVSRPSRYTLRIAIESAGSAKTARYEYAETTEDEVEVVAPSGNKYSLVIEFEDADTTSLSVDSEDDECSFYFAGSGNMKINARFANGDMFNGEIAVRAG